MSNGGMHTESPEWGRMHALTRQPNLPSDMQCDGCGGVIPDGEHCFTIERGTNSKGSIRVEDSKTLCRECMEDR